MELKEVLIQTPQQEMAGSRTASRLDFQKNWALQQMLKKHILNQDYVFVFEYHDDVLSLDSVKSPKSLNFYQVKTLRGKNWTLNKLTKQEKGKKGLKISFIGKLYQHKENFSDFPLSLNFVTNTYFSFDKENSEICASLLKQKEQDKLIDEIKKQVPGLKKINLDELNFNRTDLSLEDHETHIKGELHNFFNHFFGINHTIPIESWYTTITDEIKRKNNFPQSRIKSFDDLIRNKSLTKDRVDNFLSQVKNTHRVRPKWDTVCTILSKANIPSKDLLEIEGSWNKYSVEKLDQSNEQLNQISEAIKKITNKKSIPDNDLWVYTNKIYSIFKNDHSFRIVPFDKKYIKAVILWEYCEKLQF